MKLLELSSEWEISKWVFYQYSDTKEIRDLITSNWFIYLYCNIVEDREDMWRKIKDKTAAWFYCKNIKDRPELRKIFKDEIIR